MAAPELRLNVTLDLAFFRTQVQKLTAITQSEFAPRLNVKFNRQTLDTELNNLQRAIKRRVYRIEIGGNIDALPKKIQGIKEGLAALETQKKVEIPIGIKNGVTQEDATTVVAAMYRKIRESGLENTGGKIRIPVSIKPSITKKDVTDFKKAVKDSLSGITVNVKANVQGGGFAGSAEGAAGLMEYMKKEGMIGKTASGMQMRMKNESNDKGRIQRSALDQLARAIFFMAGIDPSQIRAKRRQIPDVDWASTIPSRPPSIGPSSGGRALPFGAIPSSLPGTAFGSQKYLPTALGEELKQILRGAAYAFVDSFKQNIRTVKVTESPQSLLGGRVPAGLLPGRPSQTNVLELNNILAGAIREYFKAVARGVTAQAGGAFEPTKQSLLPGARVAGLLTPSVGRTPSRYSTAGETTQELFARREREARMRSALRSVDTLREGGVAGRAPSPYSTAYRGARSREAIVPYSAGGALVQSGGAPRPPSSGGRGSGFFGGMQFAMPKLPGAGIVQGLGTEFAFAAKQVLLFGTAYKALAFLTDFPSQVGAAVGQLQSFRNTLNAVSPSAQEAAQSSQFILDVVDKYNVPLQSARDGFTRLYASMQPAGFGGNEIRDLFLGISQAAATFGMSADKVDRVNYAFAQMASKGQVMSEELKGQLGDVLPGSMALFAEAAGFKGPQAITKFSKALEDGVYKGGAMKTLLTNVGIVMSKEFGPGAEGAAKTFQGSINRMQNSLKLFYETFEPVAVGFLNAVVTPMTSGIKTLTDGFNAFFTGQAAQTTSGNVLAQQLEQLRPAFDGIRNNITQILPLLQSFGKTALSLGSILLQIAGNPFVGYLARVYLAVLPLTIAIQALNLSALIPLIRNLLAAVPAFVAFTVSQLRGMSTLGSFKAATYGLGLTAAATGVKIRLLSGIIKTAFATTVIGVALLGIGMLIEKLMMAGFKADEAKQKMLQFADSVKQAGKAGDVAGLVTTLAEEKGMAKRMQNAKALLEEIKKGKKSISEQQKQELEGLGLTSNMAFFQEGGPKNLSKNLTVQVSMFGVLDANIQAAQRGYLEAQTKIIQSQKALNVAKTKQVKEEKELEKIKFEGGDDGKAAEKEAERQAKLQDKLANRDQQLAVDAANRRVALDQSTFDSRLRMSDAEYNHLRALQDDYFERQISGLDSIEARQKKHQQDLTAIENRRIDSIRKAELDAVKAVQDLRSASIKAAAVTGGTPGGAYLQGNIGPTSTGPHFDVKKQGGGFFPRNYLDPYVAVNGAPLSTGTTVPGGTFAAHQARGSHGWDYAFGAGRHAATLKGGAEWMGGVPTAHGEKREFKIPTGEIFSFLHGGSEGINARPISAATRSGAFAMGRREDKAEGQLAVEQQDAQNRAVEKLATIRNANNLALQQTITLVKQNIDSIFPLREQQLENDLLELRNNLESKGVSKQMIDMEVEKAKRSKESALAAEGYTKKIDKSTAALERYNKMKTLTPEDKLEMARLTAEIDLYKKTLADLPELQGQFNNELARTATLTTESSFESAMTSLKDRMKMAQAFTPGQELKTQIALDNPDLSPEQQQVLFDTTQATIKLEELKEKVKNISQSIGDALGNSLNSGIQGLIAGTANAQQIFSDFLKSMGDILIQEGVKMIATYTAIAIAKSLAGLFGGGGGGGSLYGGGGGEALGQAGSFGGNAFSNVGGIEFGSFGVGSFAEGGRPPIGRPSLVGELGPELFVPSSSGTIIPADATAAAMARYQRQGGGSGAGSSSSDAMGDGAATPVLSMSFETTRFLGQDYVSTEQLQAAMAATERRATTAGAKAGAAQVASQMRNSPGYRRQVGLR
jgi:tape measure domain-containing protein